MDITNWCGTNDIREYIRTPFNIGDRTMASNGHVLISIPKNKNYAAPKKSSFVKTIEGLLDIDKTNLQPFPADVVLPDLKECPVCAGTKKASQKTCDECDGEGEVDAETAYNTYEVECKSCNGEGGRITRGGDDDCFECHGVGRVAPNDSTVKIYDITLDAKYVALIKDMPDLQIKTSENYLYFQSGENEGLIMGLRV